MPYRRTLARIKRDEELKATWEAGTPAEELARSTGLTVKRILEIVGHYGRGRRPPKYTWDVCRVFFHQRPKDRVKLALAQGLSLQMLDLHIRRYRRLFESAQTSLAPMGLSLTADEHLNHVSGKRLRLLPAEVDPFLAAPLEWLAANAASLRDRWVADKPRT